MMDTTTTSERTTRTETDRPSAPSLVAVILASAVAVFLVASLFVRRSPEAITEYREIVAVIVGSLATYMSNRYGGGR